MSLMKGDPGQRFAVLRAERGYTQKTLAEAMSPVRCTDQAISDFETGVSTKMRLTRWYRIAAVFGMSIEDLNRRVFGNAAGRLPRRAAGQRTVQPPPTPSSDQFADQALMSMTKNELKWLLIRVLSERERRGMPLISADIVKKFPALGHR